MAGLIFPTSTLCGGSACILSDFLGIVPAFPHLVLTFTLSKHLHERPSCLLDTE